MKNYTVRISCEVAGRWREAGETVTMTEEQARYLVAPLGNVLIEPDAETEQSAPALADEGPLEDQASAVSAFINDQPLPQGAQTAPEGIPFMITKDARRRLSELGHSAEEIRNMTPSEAKAILEAVDGGSVQG